MYVEYFHKITIFLLTYSIGTSVVKILMGIPV